MKFVEMICNIGRTGKLCDLPKPWHNDVFKTPMFFTYARAGTVPHLTYDSLKYLDVQKMIISHALPTIIDFDDAVKSQSLGLGVFTGLTDYPLYISIQDPGSVTPTGYNVKKGVSLWTHGGKKLLSTRDFMSAIKAFRPAFYQALCDSDTQEDSSKKRVTKAVDNSLNFLDECLEDHISCGELKDVAVFGSVQGGYDLYLRKKSAEETAKRAVDGFVIDGFHLNGPAVRNIDFSKVELILNHTVPHLPRDKPRVMNGALTPDMILEAIKCGIDIFDSSYAYVLTEAGEASVYPLSSVEEFFKFEHLENVSKRSKQTYEIVLRDKIYADDFTPILNSCSCYTCKHYTRAYVNHLLTTTELLAYILLMIHNLHHFIQFFDRIRATMENDHLNSSSKRKK